MAGDKDFQRRLEIIERGIRELEAIVDPGLRATARQLVESILELHGTGLERVLEIVQGSGIAGPPIIDRLGHDPVVSNLMLLHSLHPLTLEARVTEALAGVQVTLRQSRGEVALLDIVDGAVRLRVVGTAEQQVLVEGIVIDAAPDAASISVERTDAAVGFVSLDSLRRPEPPRSAPPDAPSVALAGGA